MIYHLDFKIDKQHYKNMFYDNVQEYGVWHWSNIRDKKLWWHQLFIEDNHPLKKSLKEIENDLNIYGLNNYPRFSYQFPNTLLPHHLDEDEMVSINLNLLDTIPIIHLEHKPYPYEAIFVDVGGIMHGVEKDPNPRLILKFCLRHPWEEICELLDKKNLIKYG
jgi:hypothetical protein